MGNELQLYFPIVKIDKEKRRVYGFATTEEIDQSGEIVDYEASKEAFSEWAQNIREMHQLVAVGKAVEIIPDDKKRGIWVGSYISKGAQTTWEKILDGTLSGYSVGGVTLEKILESKKIDGKEVTISRIVKYRLNELSLVDSPCNASCEFEMIKSIRGSTSCELTDIILDPDEIEKGKSRRESRDGSGPYGDSAQASISDIGIRQEAGEICPHASLPPVEDIDKGRTIMTFTERWKASELTTSIDALTQVLREIVYEILFNGELSKKEKTRQIKEALREFTVVVSSKVPDAAEYFSRCVANVLTGEVLTKLNEVGRNSLVKEKTTEEKVEPKGEEKVEPKVEEKVEPKVEEKVEPKVEEPGGSALEKRISVIEQQLSDLIDLMKKSTEEKESSQKVDTIAESLDVVTKRFNAFMGEPAPRKEAAVVEKTMTSGTMGGIEGKKVEEVNSTRQNKIKALIVKRAAGRVIEPEDQSLLDEEFKRLVEEKGKRKKK